MNIEIKGNDPEALATADALVALLTEHDALERSVVTSFDDDVVTYFHAKAPTVMMTPGLNMATEFVLGGVTPPEWARIMQVPPVYEGIEVFTADYVSRARAAGLVTWVWPNGDGEDEAGYTALLELGADGINASDPAAGMAALNAFLGNDS
jgi:glycerophosphoryl diester phosphodiesterase